MRILCPEWFPLDLGLLTLSEGDEVSHPVPYFYKKETTALLCDWMLSADIQSFPGSHLPQDKGRDKQGNRLLSTPHHSPHGNELKLLVPLGSTDPGMWSAVLSIRVSNSLLTLLGAGWEHISLDFTGSLSTGESEHTWYCG